MRTRTIGERLTNPLIRTLDLPADVGQAIPRLLQFGNRELIIENYGVIATFTPELIEVRYGDGQRAIQVNGQELTIVRFDDTELEVRGIIQQMKFV